jgi:hypothetical protein
VDSNQKEIVSALRKAGATVQVLSSVGDGCPDILVGHRSKNYLLEIKDGTAPPSQRKLTPDEQNWHDAWAGSVQTVHSLWEALGTIGIKTVPE